MDPWFSSSAGALVAILGLLLCPVAGAQVSGDQSADRWVTIAARECDSYTDIRANLARNDIMESLQDLGKDTLYEPGDLVDPRIEAVGQPKCRPVVGWRFTFGESYVSRAVSGPWGALSIVTDPDAQQPVTKDSVPAKDFDGNPVGGGAKIDGAVTVGLNRDQVDRAAANRLWIQGGTPEDPVLYSDPQFAGRYGFGALRCAIDDLNGDNVETIQFPAGARHVFCYAYYVTPPPSSGTIVIRKQVQGSGDAAETFAFRGNVSYEPGGAFELSASDGNPGSTEFLRGETRPGDAPWTVVEDAQDGWSLTSLSCTSASSTTTTDLAARSVQINLTAGDTVTCTFTNRLTPPAGALVLRKVTEDGTGSFPFSIRDADGDVVARRTLTTRAPGGLGAVRVIKLEPGRYTIRERRPATGQGIWRLSGVRCNGARRDPRQPVTVEITAGRGAVCTFTNRLDHPGQINIAAVTINGLGRAGYLVTRAGERAAPRVQFATTRRQGRTAPASGESTHGLPFGRYVIRETAAAAGERAVWSLIAVSCNGRILPFEQGRVTVELTRTTPRQDCTFVNLRQRAPVPPPEPEPTPTPTPGPAPEPFGPSPSPVPVPGGSPPDLALDKRQVASTGGQAPILTFLLRVTNRSDVGATRVVVADRLAAGTALVSADPSQGRCLTRGARLLMCTLGDLAPGASASIRVRVQHFDAGAGVNVAVVGAGSPEEVLRNNVAAARIAAVRRPAGACPARGAC
jgi:uncharacterized repeat protein (TIGR01451 family)